jgi:hypothetical protein
MGKSGRRVAEGGLRKEELPLSSRRDPSSCLGVSHVPLARAGTAAATLNGLEYRDGGGFDSLRSGDKYRGEGIEAALQEGSVKDGNKTASRNSQEVH